MASAIIEVEHLRELGAHTIDLAGFLTPWALHSFDGVVEQPVQRVESGKTIQKMFADKKRTELPNSFEGMMPELNAAYGWGINNMFVFSLQHGYEKLSVAWNELMRSQGYDMVVAIDIGGDILAQQQDVPLLRTPIVDMVCLKLLKETQLTGVSTALGVIGLGTDGEIPIERMQEIRKEYECRGCIIYEHAVHMSSGFTDAMHIIDKKMNVRSGTHLAMKYCEGRAHESHVDFPITRMYRVGQKIFSQKDSMKLDPSLALSAMYLPVEDVQNTITSVVPTFESMLELQKIFRPHTLSTELDLKFVDGIFMCTPPRDLHADMRKEIIKYAMEYYRNEGVPVCMLNEDRELGFSEVHQEVRQLSTRKQSLYFNRH